MAKLPKPFDTLRTWVVKESGNKVHVQLSEHNNGQAELIHYTSVRRHYSCREGEDGWRHVDGSSIGHGYGKDGLEKAEERVANLLAEGWRRFAPDIVVESVMRS